MDYLGPQVLTIYPATLSRMQGPLASAVVAMDSENAQSKTKDATAYMADRE